MPQTERRQHPRVSARLGLQLVLQDRAVKTHIEDLSNSGIRFRSPAALALMSRVQLAIELPNGASGPAAGPFSVTGVVVRCDLVDATSPAPYDTAIFFTELSEAVRRQIARFVAVRLR